MVICVTRYSQFQRVIHPQFLRKRWFLRILYNCIKRPIVSSLLSYCLLGTNVTQAVLPILIATHVYAKFSTSCSIAVNRLTASQTHASASELPYIRQHRRNISQPFPVLHRTNTNSSFGSFAEFLNVATPKTPRPPTKPTWEEYLESPPRDPSVYTTFPPFKENPKVPMGRRRVDAIRNPVPRRVKTREERRLARRAEEEGMRRVVEGWVKGLVGKP